MAKEVSPGVKALRKVVDDVHADARRAHAEGKLVGWSSSKFPCELAAAFDLDVMYPENQAAGIAADDVAQESRAFRVDASEEGDPMMALAQQFADQDYDILLYDEHSEQNRRADFVVDKIKKSGAQGLVLFMQQFCDPEEMEYPYLKKALDAAGIPHIKLGVDQQMRDFGQASTAIQAFADVL